MNNSVNFKIERSSEYDVCVVGGGIAGCCAAISAARNGAKTLLVESSGVLGGQGTLGIVTPISATRTKDGISFGGLVKEITDEVVSLSKKYCTCGESKEDVIDIAAPHIVKYVLLDKVQNSGTQIMFHSSFLSSQTENDRIESIIIHDANGLMRIFAKEFIDATGDALLICGSGADYVKGSEEDSFDSLKSTGFDKTHDDDNQEGGSYTSYTHGGLMQPVSIFFTLGGVDTLEAYKLNNKELHFGDLGITREKFSTWEFCNTPGFELSDDDKIPMPQGRILVTRTTRKGVVAVNMSRVIGIDGSNADSLTKGEITAQKQIIAIIDFLKTFIPAFKDAYYIQSGSTLGIRETNRMIGKYVLTGLDAINCREFEDCIARGSYMIDIHDPNGKSRAIGGYLPKNYYDIPYRSIISNTYSNLFACGRCISSDHVAHASTRIMGTCMMTGQAAGTAAAILSKQGIQSSEIDIVELRKNLIENGMYI